MLDFFAIHAKGGALLFLYAPAHTATSSLQPILNAFVDAVLIGDTHASAATFNTASTLIKWRVKDNLVFVCGWQKVLPIGYADELLEQVEQQFIVAEAPLQDVTADFHEAFLHILHKVEHDHQAAKRQSKASPVPNVSKQPSATASTANKKAMTRWGDKVSKQELAALDYSQPSSKGSRPVKESRLGLHQSTMDELRVEEEDDERPSRLLSLFQSLTGGKALDSDDLRSAITAMHDHLVAKNVAVDAARFIVGRVEGCLLGEKTGAFRTTAILVRRATEDAVRELLLSAKPIDLVSEIEACRGKRPYAIAFIGVNGVGKSTNLAKVCYWLLHQRYRILVAACDTFRSGAVEQLRQHVDAFKAIPGAAIELFERGYGKDSATIAADALRYAARGTAFDVVLIDTAGRMQDNAPLMKALVKLVAVNQPDRLIFVGEALVGNEALNQLGKFNQSLKDYAPAGEAHRRIDGILLTKFDTVDDKVPAPSPSLCVGRSCIVDGLCVGCSHSVCRHRPAVRRSQDDEPAGHRSEPAQIKTRSSPRADGDFYYSLAVRSRRAVVNQQHAVNGKALQCKGQEIR